MKEHTIFREMVCFYFIDAEFSFKLVQRHVCSLNERNPRFTSGIQDLRAESKIYERNPRFTSGIQDLRAESKIYERNP
ncbi:hypothetical protein, partial [Fictibacillus barbaricus]